MDGEIIVVFEERGGTNKTAIDSRTGQTKHKDRIAAESEKAQKKLQEAKQAFISYGFNQVLNTTKSIARNEAVYEIYKYYNLTDNAQAERDMNIAMNIAGKTISLVESAIIGAQMGATLGPIGAAAGAAIGLVAGVAKTAVDIYQGYDQQNIKIMQQEEQLKFNRSRAGYSLTAGDKGENR